jgi:L-asparagine oxygenase
MTSVASNLTARVDHMFVDKLRDCLAVQGWAYMLCDTSLLTLCRVLRSRPVQSRRTAPIIQNLELLEASVARPLSLSAQHGLGAFPYHTDCAHHRIPPRYCAMRLSECDGACRPTLLKDVLPCITSAEWDILSHECWIASPGRSRFIATIGNKAAHARYLRFDEGCMRPALPKSSKSQLVLRNIIEAIKPVEINWHKDYILVLDNWRVMHSRPASMPDVQEGRRVLKRILLQEKIP